MKSEKPDEGILMIGAKEKMAFILLAIMAVGYAAAPSWVAGGASLTYSVGSDSVTFNVMSVSGEDIEIDVIPSTTGKVSRATENKSLDSGQFWYDSAKLASASVGSTVGDFTVAGTGKQTFAGREWDTVTLVDTVSGSVTTKVYSLQGGLLLKQSVDKAGVPVITLARYAIPGLDVPPATQPPAQPIVQNDTATPQSNATAPDVTAPVQNASGAQEEEEPSGSGETTAPPASGPSDEKGACASGAILLAVFGFAAFRKD
ncbi:hypothetical protein L0Y65_05610 [Candidatus Micrarchaeota archaeon]|nr:hypothetical protein [Candidatus Micrarchaeota archaeon]